MLPRPGLAVVGGPRAGRRRRSRRSAWKGRRRSVAGSRRRQAWTPAARTPAARCRRSVVARRPRWRPRSSRARSSASAVAGPRP